MRSRVAPREPSRDDVTFPAGMAVPAGRRAVSIQGFADDMGVFCSAGSQGNELGRRTGGEAGLGCPCQVPWLRAASVAARYTAVASHWVV